MGPNQAKKLLHSKGNKGTVSRMGEIFANDTADKCLISKIYKQLLMLNVKEKNKKQPSQKLGRRPI